MEVEKYIKKHPCEIWCPNHAYITCPRTHTQSKDPKICHTASLETNPAQRQVVTDWQLPAQQLIPKICTPPVAAGQMGRGSNCSWVGPVSFNKTKDSTLRTTDPSVPQFPTPAWPNPLSWSVWTCRAESSVPMMLSRHHTMIALALLTSLDYSLTTWTFGKRRD